MWGIHTRNRKARSMLLLTANILAQTAPKSGGGGFQFMFAIILMIGVFYFVMYRSNSKTKQKRADLINNIKKNDKIMTIGGILGTVVSVKEREIVVKVDESTNTKMTFLKDAVRQVVQDDTELSVENK